MKLAKLGEEGEFGPEVRAFEKIYELKGLAPHHFLVEMMAPFTEMGGGPEHLSRMWSELWARYRPGDVMPEEIGEGVTTDVFGKLLSETEKTIKAIRTVPT